MSFPLDSIWKLTILNENEKISKETTLVVIEASNIKFKAHEIANTNHIFQCEARIGEFRIINIIETDSKTDYIAFYIGSEFPTGLIRFKGQWIDIKGKKGEFELVNVK